MLKTWLLSLAWLALVPVASARDTLLILSPHRKSIQDEYVPRFVTYYKEKFKTDVQVEWLDQGGTSDDIRFLRAKFAKNPKSSGLDIFWGGGTTTFLQLKEEGFLDSYKLSTELKAQIPAAVAGIPLYDASQTWYASAMSSFGVFFNKKIMEFERLPEPKQWQDLGHPQYRDNISLTDPRRSGTASTMNTILLQTFGWEKGWELLTAIAGNTRSFTHTSTDPIKAVVSGDVAMAMAIDFYALAKIGDLGRDNLGFTLPEGQSVLDPDPVAILKGAPNRKVAERFVDFVLSVEGQKLLILPKGSAGGPKLASLGRMAANVKAYEATEGQRIDSFNPFKQKTFVTLDLDKALRMQRVFNDMVGALLVDPHSDLRRAWARIGKDGKVDPSKLQAIGKPPVSEAEFNALVARWDDEVVRNQTINSWLKYSRKKYRSTL